MKRFLSTLFVTVLALFSALTISYAAINIVPNGGTGVGTITGIIKGNGQNPFTAASAGTDYQAPITLTVTGNSGASTFISNTLNIPTYTADGLLPSQTGNNGKFLTTNGTTTSWGTISSGGVTSIASADGSISVTNPTTTVDLAVVKAPKWSTARNLAGNSVDGSANVAFTNKFIVQGTTDTGLSGAQFLGALSTGILKNTTTTGVLSIASAGTDYEVPLTFSTGLTRSTNTVTVNTSQNIAKLTNLTSNGFVKTSAGDGTLSIDTSTYLTSAITSLNGLTAATQTFAQPTAGLTITSNTSTHTFALADDLLAVEGLSTNGVAIRTGTSTWATRTITGTSNRISLSNGDGVSGNPTIDIAATYVGQTSITTLGTVTTGTLSTGSVIGGVTMTLGSDASYDLYYRSSGGVLTRLANGTTGQVLSANTGAAPTWSAPPASGATAISLIPQPVTPSNGSTSTNNINTYTTMFVSATIIDAPITVNSISVYIENISSNGTFKIGLWSQSGATQYFSVTSGTVSVSGVITISVGSVVLQPGVYYIGIVGVTPSNFTPRFYSGISTGPFGSPGLLNGVSGKSITQGTLTVTAGTIPSTITPTSISYSSGTSLIYRIDN